MKKLVLMLCCMLWANLNYADVQSNCLPVKVKIQNKNVLLLASEKKGNPALYFLKNSSAEAIWIDHPTRKNLSAGWSSYLRAGKWSAFLVDKKDFTINCSAIRPGKVDSLDCLKVLSICAPKEITFKTASKNSYWVAEDKSWDDLIKIVNKRGIVLRNANSNPSSPKV